VLGLLRRFGWNATSFQVLEPGLSYWFADAEACVAYVDTGRAWVAAGAPLCAEGRLAEVARRFLEAARREGRRGSFFAAEERLLQATGLPAIHVGEQPVWDPRAWEGTLKGSRSLREQLRRARAKGVSVRRPAPEELAPGAPLRREAEALVRRWQGAHALPPMGFLVQLEPFELPEERRTFVAEQGGRLVGLLAAVPVFARGGWFFEDLLRDPAAPNGTAELLVDAAMRQVAGEGSRFVTLGMAPLSGEVGGWLRAARKGTRAFYDFEGLRAFKGKLRPERWDVLSVAHPPGQSAALTLLDVLTAFSRGGLLVFGVETLLRGPALLLRALAVALVPWTALLALAPVEPYFPSAEVKWAWVAFDVGLAAGFFALLRRWRRPLATLLASLVTLDAGLTLWQAAAHAAPRVHTAGQGALVALAVAGPSAAAVMLWRARAHRETFT
jgi:phosphatidylglycerol lysyltransferase